MPSKRKNKKEIQPKSAAASDKSKMRLREVILNNDTNAIKAIITSEGCNKSLLTSIDADGLTPLHLAVNQQNLTAVQLILASQHSKESLLIEAGGNRYSPLHLAILKTSYIMAAMGNTTDAECIVDELLHFKSDLPDSNVLTTTDIHNYTPFHLALVQNCNKIVDKILALPHCGPALQMRDYHDNTPLNWAISRGRHADIEKILRSPYCRAEAMLLEGENHLNGLNQYAKAHQRTPLLCEIISGKTEAVIASLSKKCFTAQQGSYVNQFLAAANIVKTSLTNINSRLHFLDLLESTDQFIKGEISVDAYSKKISSPSTHMYPWSKCILRVMGSILSAAVAATALSCLAVSCGVTLPYAFALKALMVLPNTVPVQLGYGSLAAASTFFAYKCGKSARENLNAPRALPNVCNQIKDGFSPNAASTA